MGLRQDPQRLLLKAALTVVSLWVVSMLILLTTPYLPGWDERSAFGDMFGAVNALFSGLASAGVIIAILLQWEELKLQRNELGLQRCELEQTREELRGQKEQMEGQKQQLEIQNETRHQQQAEATFFRLLSLCNELVGSMDLRVVVGQREPQGGANLFTPPEPIYEKVVGRDCFKEMYEFLRRQCMIGAGAGNGAGDAELVAQAFRATYNEFQTDLSPYFRVLANVLRFVDQSTLRDKTFYAGLVRAQMCTYELAMLFYYTVADEGQPLRELVEKYHLFQDLPHVLLLKRTHAAIISREAFAAPHH